MKYKLEIIANILVFFVALHHVISADTRVGNYIGGFFMGSSCFLIVGYLDKSKK